MPQLDGLPIGELSSELCESLRLAGVQTAEQLLCADERVLAGKCGVTVEVIENAMSVTADYLAPFPQRGNELYTAALSGLRFIATSGFREDHPHYDASIDKLLSGGLLTSELCEIVGQTATGKTQFCLTTAINAILSGDCNVCYVDTTGSFSVERLIEIYRTLQPPNVDETQAETELAEILATRIRCFKAFDIYTAMSILDEVKHAIDKGVEPFFQSMRLLIIDSITAIIAPVLGQMPQGHRLMSSVAKQMKDLSSAHRVAVLITNNTVSGGNNEEFKPALGESWTSVASTQLFLLSDPTARQDPGGTRRVAVLSRCSRGAVGASRAFTVTAAGITPVVSL